MLYDVWSAIIREKAESGLTAVDYCKKHRLPTSTYYYWYGKVKKTGKHSTVQRLMDFKKAKMEDSLMKKNDEPFVPLIVIRFGAAEVLINKDTPDDLIFKVLAEARKAS